MSEYSILREQYLFMTFQMYNNKLSSRYCLNHWLLRGEGVRLSQNAPVDGMGNDFNRLNVDLNHNHVPLVVRPIPRSSVDPTVFIKLQNWVEAAITFVCTTFNR